MAANVSKRRASSDGYARGIEQRARIIQAALKVFGDQGYERASTRMIAAEAGIQPPALQYYFDSKEGLNRACGEFIVEQGLLRIGKGLAQAAATPDDAPPEVALEALCWLADALFDSVLFKHDARQWSHFTARAQSENSPAAEIMRDRISRPISETAARLVGQVLATPVDEIVRLRASIVMSQMSAFTVYREITLARLGWTDLEEPRRSLVKAMLRTHIRGALGFAPKPQDETATAGETAPRAG